MFFKWQASPTVKWWSQKTRSTVKDKTNVDRILVDWRLRAHQHKIGHLVPLRAVQYQSCRLSSTAWTNCIAVFHAEIMILNPLQRRPACVDALRVTSFLNIAVDEFSYFIVAYCSSVKNCRWCWLACVIRYTHHNLNKWRILIASVEPSPLKK